MTKTYEQAIEEAAKMVDDVATNAMTTESEQLLMKLSRLIAFIYGKGPYDVASEVGRIIRGL